LSQKYIQPINLFEYEALAQERLSPMAWSYYSSGALDQITLQENRKAFNHYRLLPKILVDVGQRDCSVNILENIHPSPVLIAPMAFQRLANSKGELATAKAAAQAGTTMILSTLSTQSLEEVSSFGCNRWFQLYIHKDRTITYNLIERAKSAGYSALVVTVDAPILGRRETDSRNRFSLPQGMDLANFKNKLPSSANNSALFDYFVDQIDPCLSWHDIEHFQSLTDLPILLKGILRVDDAQRALEIGVKGIIVSNHGGRQLDGAIASLVALPKIAQAVGQDMTVLFDGGIRRGSDIFKALALGAKAVLVGRPILWGLSVNGSDGVSHVLEILQRELDETQALTGCPRIEDIKSEFLALECF